MAGQIIRRGKNTYLARVYAGRDASGNRRYINKTIHGTAKDAQRWLTKALRDRDTGVLVQPSRESVGEYLGRWLPEVQSQVRSRTFFDYSYYVHHYIEPALGGRRLDQLSSDDIQGLYSAMMARGLTARTVIFCHAVLHRALKRAVERRLLVVNPSATVARPKNSSPEMHCLSASEAQRFLAAAQQDERSALWTLLLTTGMRPGEACALRWADIEAGHVRIQRTLVPAYKGAWRLEEPKTKHSRRSVPLSPSVMRALASHRARQAEERLRAGACYGDLGFVFANAVGQPLHPAFVAKGPFQRVLKAAGLVHMRLYDLRHTCATLLLANGENVKVVSERLGHASVKLTLDTYAHVLPGMQQAATAKLERLLFDSYGDFTSAPPADLSPSATVPQLAPSRPVERTTTRSA